MSTSSFSRRLDHSRNFLSRSTSVTNLGSYPAVETFTGKIPSRFRLPIRIDSTTHPQFVKFLVGWKYHAFPLSDSHLLPFQFRDVSRATVVCVFECTFSSPVRYVERLHVEIEHSVIDDVHRMKVMLCSICCFLSFLCCFLTLPLSFYNAIFMEKLLIYKNIYVPSCSCTGDFFLYILFVCFFCFILNPSPICYVVWCYLALSLDFHLRRCQTIYFRTGKCSPFFHCTGGKSGTKRNSHECF